MVETCNDQHAVFSEAVQIAKADALFLHVHDPLSTA